MAANNETQELKDRLDLIETMIAEGRRKTESWGWVFVLWGVAYYVAIVWSAWGRHDSLAWNVTMMAAMLLTWGTVALRINRNQRTAQPGTTLGRAITAVWVAVGVSMLILIPSLGIGGLSNSRLIVAVIGTMLGTANAASSIILKWKAQFACALVWWAAAVISCLGTTRQSFIALLVANFLCQIVFGIYGMLCEMRARKQGAIYA